MDKMITLLGLDKLPEEIIAKVKLCLQDALNAQQKDDQKAVAESIDKLLPLMGAEKLDEKTLQEVVTKLREVVEVKAKMLNEKSDSFESVKEAYKAKLADKINEVKNLYIHEKTQNVPIKEYVKPTLSSVEDAYIKVMQKESKKAVDKVSLNEFAWPKEHGERLVNDASSLTNYMRGQTKKERESKHIFLDDLSRVKHCPDGHLAEGTKMTELDIANYQKRGWKVSKILFENSDYKIKEIK